MGTSRILVVDDDAVVRQVVSSSLERAGYEVIPVGTAADAIELLQNGPEIDVLMSDVMMPGTDGLALLDAVSRDFPVPVVLFTALHDLHVATDAFRRGAFDYLLKPISRKDLLAAAERAAEHCRRQRQLVAYRTNLEDAVSERTQRLRSAMVDLERSYDVTLEAMGDALDLRDEETEGHSKRVTAYTIALARAFGVPRPTLKTIARGAFLHDVGKIAIPDSILLKPSRLTDAEMAIMREHCARGYEIIRKIPFLADAAEIVYSHQEKYDGTGYPRGLRGEAIPLGARIFAVADALDAITSDRPYRKGRSFEEAFEEVRNCSGTHFDPEIVRVFLELPQETWSGIRSQVGKNSIAKNFSAQLRPDRASRHGRIGSDAAMSPKFSIQELNEAMNPLPGWTIDETGRIGRMWLFRDFVEAMKFVAQVADLAEEEGHHPDIDIRYNRVRLSLITHDEGGVTERDLAMARILQNRFPEHLGT